jgi:5-methylcytosine-specific restriction endonuclease McrA
MIGPHLTPENHVEVLGRAKFRTKKELSKLIRELHPLPRVPDCIEPLGPSLRQSPRTPTWAEFAASLCPPVRELPADERPRDWANDGFRAVAVGESSPPGGDSIELGDEMLPEVGEALPVGPVPADLPPVTGSQLYQMQFSTVEEHVQLIERAKALLARERPGATLGELHLEAMKMFVAALEKRKFAVTERPRKPNAKLGKLGQREPSAIPRQRVSHEPSEAPRRRLYPPAGQPPEPPRQRGRYIPAAERREVYRRDCGRCSYVDARGERCCATRYLEVHHLQPFARQGAHVAANLALRCRAHNRLAAERDFGPELIAKKRPSLRHEALAVQIHANTKR